MQRNLSMSSTACGFSVGSYQSQEQEEEVEFFELQKEEEPSVVESVPEEEQKVEETTQTSLFQFQPSIVKEEAKAVVRRAPKIQTSTILTEDVLKEIKDESIEKPQPFRKKLDENKRVYEPVKIINTPEPSKAEEQKAKRKQKRGKMFSVLPNPNMEQIRIDHLPTKKKTIVTRLHSYDQAMFHTQLVDCNYRYNYKLRIRVRRADPENKSEQTQVLVGAGFKKEINGKFEWIKVSSQIGYFPLRASSSELTKWKLFEFNLGSAQTVKINNETQRICLCIIINHKRGNMTFDVCSGQVTLI